MLTARDAVEDRVGGLDAGADDYLDEAVLVRGAARAAARARAARAGRAADRCSRSATCGSIPAAHRAWRGDDELDLSAKEFALLEMFMRRPGEALSRAQLLDGAWDIGVREPLERRRRLRPLPAREDRPARSAATRSRRCAASATGCERTRVSRLPIRVRLTLPSRSAMASSSPRWASSSTCASATRCSRRSTRASRAQAHEATTHARGGPSCRPRRRRAASHARAAARRRRARAPSSQPPGLPPLLVAGASRARRRRRATLRGPSSSAGPSGEWRLLAAPPAPAAGRAVLVVARSLDAARRALDRLRHELLARPPAGAAARRPRRLRARGRGAAAGRGDAPARGGDHGRDAGRGCPSRRARRDLAPRDDAERDARAARGAVEHERRFVADASHELRTPLALLRPSSSSRCAGRARARSSRRRCARPPRRPSGSRGSRRTCC